MGAKRAKPAQVDRFREDADLIEQAKKLSNREMADLMVVDASYLSGCRAGSSNPGKDMIDKFYSTFGEDLEKINKYTESTQSTKVEEEQKDEDPLLSLLKDNDRFLKNETRVTNRTNEKIAETNFLEAQNRQALIQANKDMAQSTRELADSIRLLLEKNNPSSPGATS